MWFKITYSLAGMFLGRPDKAPIHISLEPENNGEITFWIRKSPHIPNAKELCVTLLVEKHPGENIVRILDSIRRNIFPQDDPPLIQLPYSLSSMDDTATIDEEGNVPPSWGIPFKILPMKFQNFAAELHGQLYQVIGDFVRLLRWVQRTPGRHNPFALVEFRWSSDAVNWYFMPVDASVRVSDSGGIDTSSTAIETIKSLYACGTREPLCHELLREAFDIASINPRSALLIGMSAVETGLKSYIGTLVKNSNVIFEHLQSPSVLTLSQEVIPSLHEELGVNRDGFPLAEHDKAVLRKWVTQRNQVAHGRKIHVRADSLLDFLEFAQALLYKLDVYCGLSWAKKFASHEPDIE